MSIKYPNIIGSISEIVNAPIKLLCDSLRKKLDSHIKETEAKNEVAREKDLKEFIANLEMKQAKFNMELSVEERELNAEIDNLLYDKELNRRKQLIELEVSYRTKMTEVAQKLAQIMVELEVNNRNKLLSLYMEKEKEYRLVQENYKKDMFTTIAEIKKILPEELCNEVILDEIKIQLQSMRERADNFNSLIFNDLQNVFGIVDQSIIEITGISKKYLEPQSSGRALTQKIVDTIEISDDINVNN
jgi:hypothetical protein